MMLLLLTGLAFAQEVPIDAIPEVNTQLFRPSVDARRTLWADPSGSWRGSGPSFGVLGHYADSPLVYFNPQGERTAIVRSVWTTDVVGSYAWGPARIGVDVPVILRSTSDIAPSRSGVGDVSVDLRGTVLDGAAMPVGLAVAAALYLPTGTVPGVSDAGAGWDVRLIGDKSVGDLYLSGNLGSRFRPRADLETTSLGNQLSVRAGVGYALRPDTGLSFDLGGQRTYGGAGDAAAHPWEALVGGWQGLGSGWTARGGLGTAASRGLGAPRSHVLLGLSWAPESSPGDPDGDGITTDVDVCPYEAETFNGVRDADGCPEADSVSAAHSDAGRGPPLAPEATAPADQDAPPVSAEAGTLATLPRSDDVDGDGIPAYLDVCPEVAEDADGFEDEDGCPDLDDDGDGIADGADRCPAAAETVNNYMDEDGCPELAPADLAEVSGAVQGITFKSNSAALTRASAGTLGKVLAVLEASPELGLRISGHTDSKGKRDLNLQLSKDRAASVEAWLVAQGVDESRLRSEGFGPDRPVDSNDTEAGRARNRRVELSYD